MRICFLSSMHSMYDKRVFDKEARTLAAAGHEVIHLVPGDQRPHIRDGVRIETYPRPAGLLGRLAQLRRLYHRAVELSADVYHCNEVDSWMVGVAIRRLRGARVVFDVHEHYPSTFAELRCPRPLAGAVSTAIRLLFRGLTPLTDRLVFAKRSVSADFPAAPEKQILVQNFTCLDVPAAAARPRDPARLTAIHLGLLSRIRGWPQMLQAWERLGPVPFDLHLVGEINDGSQDAFRSELRRRGLEHRVRFEDWMPFPDAYARIAAADVGLVLFQPGLLNHVYALPHKMFDYMRAGLPVVVPDFAEEVSAIVREADCGLLVDTARPEAIAEALARLAAEPDLRRRLGENGRRAVYERYNWEAEARKLVAMYAQLEDEIGRRPLGAAQDAAGHPAHPVPTPRRRSTRSNAPGNRHLGAPRTAKRNG